MPKHQAKDFSEQEIKERMERALKSALSTPPKHHAKQTKKKRRKPQRLSKRVIPL